MNHDEKLGNKIKLEMTLFDLSNAYDDQTSEPILDIEDRSFTIPFRYDPITGEADDLNAPSILASRTPSGVFVQSLTWELMRSQFNI